MLAGFCVAVFACCFAVFGCLVFMFLNLVGVRFGIGGLLSCCFARDCSWCC